MRKRQRADQSNEKSGTSNPLKMGSMIHQNPAELASPRLEDRAKSLIPNKRIRSSMAELRVCISSQGVLLRNEAFDFATS